METVRSTIHYELRQSEHPACMILDVIVVLLEAFFHLIEHWNHISYCQINPTELRRGWHVVSLFEICHHSEKVDSKLLVDISLLCFLPIQRFIVLTIDQLIVILHELPKDRTCCCYSHLFLRCFAEQFSSLVFVENVSHNSLGTIDDIWTILQIRKLDSWMCLLEPRPILFEPFIFGHKYILPFFVWNQNIFKNHTNYFSRSSYRPVY